MKSITHLRLILDLTIRSYHLRFAGSYFGLLWSILVPLLSAAVTATVFSFLVGADLGPTYAGVPYAIFYFVGISIWTLMSEVISRCTMVIVENGPLITKISFPVATLPWAVLAAGLVTYMVLTIVTSTWMVVAGIPLGSGAAMAMIYLALAVVMTMGVGYLVAAFGVFVRDLGQAVPIVLSIAFFMSPITYSPDMVRAKAPPWALAFVYEWNPVGRIVDGYRASLIGNAQSIDWASVGFTFAFAVLIYAIGRYSFQKLQPGFADVL